MTPLLLIAAALLSIGVYGVLTQRNGVGVLIAVELLVNAVNLVLVGFARHLGGMAGQSFALFVIAITVAEVVVGLAILLLLYRVRGDVNVDLVQDFKQ